MHPHWAGQQLEVIRTLMERTAVYRRALGPTFLAVGILGMAGAALGVALEITDARSFVLHWMIVAVVGMAGAFFLMRRQALRDAEPFWSPPARRVAHALVPSFAAGLLAGLLVMVSGRHGPLPAWWLPVVWMILYGCALHAAGFFMPRGIRFFGWLFLFAGAVLAVILGGRADAAGLPSLIQAHWLMGANFGGLHAVYGLYLVLTPRTNPPA